MHEQAVVELRGLEIANVRLEYDRLDARVAQALVAPRIAREVVDARDLEPHEVVRVVGDALRVRLCEADTHLRCETEAMHEGAMLAELIAANQPCVVLGRCAPDGLLVEDPGAGRTDVPLDLVRDAGALHEHMDALGDVLMDARGLPQCHRVSHSSGRCRD